MRKHVITGKHVIVVLVGVAIFGLSVQLGASSSSQPLPTDSWPPRTLEQFWWHTPIIVTFAGMATIALGVGSIVGDLFPGYVESIQRSIDDPSGDADSRFLVFVLRHPLGCGTFLALATAVMLIYALVHLVAGSLGL